MINMEKEEFEKLYKKYNPIFAPMITNLFKKMVNFIKFQKLHGDLLGMMM